MAERKLHPEHHSPSKTFLCIICLILIIKLGISMFPKLQSCQLSRRSVSDTQVFTPGCGPLQSPCSSRSFDAVSQSLFPTETHHVWRYRGAEESRPCAVRKVGPLYEVSHAEVAAEDMLTPPQCHTIASILSQSEQREMSWAGAEGQGYSHHRIHLPESHGLGQRKSRGLNQAILDRLIS